MKRSVGFFMILTLATSVAFAQLTTVVSDFAVSNLTNKAVYRPSLAVSTNGNFAISWGDERPTNDGRLYGAGSIFAAMYAANGTPITPNVRVDAMKFGFFHDFSLYHSSSIFLPGGTYIVAYHMDARTTIEDIKFDDIYYAAFNSTGQPTTTNVQVNKVGNSASGYGYQPHASVFGSNFLVVYRYYINDGYNIGISTVDGVSGELVGDAAPISDATSGSRVYPCVASNGTHTVVVWTDGRTDPQMGDIYMQRFVGTAAAGVNVKVNSDQPGGYNQFARVAMNGTGAFVVVWIDARSHTGGDLYARLYNANGQPIGAEFKLTNSNSEFAEYPPSVSMDAGGNFAVAWTDSLPGQRYTAKTRAFSPTGTPLIPITEVTNSYNN
jgi:hypothetical protein